MIVLLSSYRNFLKQVVDLQQFHILSFYQLQQNRNYWKPIIAPTPGVKGKSYRRIIHFKDKYTVEPLKVTNLAGRDPITGRVVCKGIGGGIKYKFHWINWIRDGPNHLYEKPKIEKVLRIFKDGCRTSYVALIGSANKLKYILATKNMKEGDILRTHRGIPRIPILANEGDAYPLGALEVGTIVHCVEKFIGLGGFLIHAAGTYGTIISKTDDRVIIKVPSKKEFSLNQQCMAVVGQLSNHEHNTTPIGSAQKNRELGNRPRSGLWHRKDGRHGRKIKPLPPIRKYDPYAPKYDSTIQLTLNGL